MSEETPIASVASTSASRASIVVADDTWWRRAVVYQVYPRSFKDSNADGIGDIRGIIEKLPYIAELGVDAIWLNPIYLSPNVDNGYDIADYEKIQPEFGTLADFDELVAAAHQRGIRIVLDLVVNHTSDQHAWFKRAISSDPGPYRDFYIWRDAPAPGKLPNNWRSSFGGSVWEWNEQVGKYYLHLFAKEQPDLNWENPAVRRRVYGVIRFWLRHGVDGFRMDVINLISKRPGFDSTPADQDGYGSYYPGCANGPRVHEFIHEMRQSVLNSSNLIVIGETPRTTVDEAVLYTDPARKELDMLFHFEHMHVDRDGPTKWYVKPMELRSLRGILGKWQTKLAGRGWNSLYWNNHDQPRIVSRFGNDRQYRVESAKMLGTVLHMMQGTPFIYQGEEIGMTNVAFDSPEDYDDIDSRNGYRDMIAAGLPPDEAMARVHARSRDNARTPMQWTDGPYAGFTQGRPWLTVNPNYGEINAEAAVADSNSVFHYYQKLIGLRHDLDIVTTGRYCDINAEDTKVYSYLREGENEALLVVGNFTADKPTFVLPEDIGFSSFKQLLSNYSVQREPNRFVLNPYESTVLLLRGYRRDIDS